MLNDLIARLRAGTASPVEAADALEAQARRIAELEREIERKDLIIYKYDKRIYFLMDKEKEQAARIAELEAALKPFADVAEYLDDTDADRYAIWEHGVSMNITIGDLRAARAAFRK
jgi:Mn-dependent DtxR family transcriptional regulator